METLFRVAGPRDEIFDELLSEQPLSSLNRQQCRPAPASTGEAVCISQAGAALGEGPCWSVAEQALYWVDILNRTLYRHTPGASPQKQRSWQFDEQISAVVERDNGAGLLVSMRHGFAFFDPVSGALEYIAHPEYHLPENRFNDGKCDRAGRFWAGSMHFEGRQPTGALYRLGCDLRCVRIDSNYTITNGPAWSLDQKSFYHNDSACGRVYVYDFDLSSGELANKRLFLEFSDDDGVPDGMTTDAEGGLWIAHWGAGKLTRHAADGVELDTIALPCSQVTSCVFGGPTLRTMFITTAAAGLNATQMAREPLAGAVFAVEMAIAGQPPNLFCG